MKAIWTGLAPSSASQPPTETINTTAAETISSAITSRRASCDAGLRRLGCSITIVGHDGATIALRASGLRRSP